MQNTERTLGFIMQKTHNSLTTPPTHNFQQQHLEIYIPNADLAEGINNNGSQSLVIPSMSIMQVSPFFHYTRPIKFISISDSQHVRPICYDYNDIKRGGGVIAQVKGLRKCRTTPFALTSIPREF